MPDENEEIERLKEEIKKLYEITVVCTDICVLHTTVDAKMRKYEMKVLQKRVKIFSQER